MDSKHWSDDPKTWFLCIIDQGTQYHVPCVVRSKKKVILKIIFKHWVSIYSFPKKSLVDNGGEFANSNFITFCENFNFRICTVAAKVLGAMGSLKVMILCKV